MNKGTLLATVIIIAVLGIIAFTAYLANISFDTTVEFRLQDVNSKASVRDATIKLQNRVIFNYFDEVLRFSNLKPGEYNIEISAPNYIGKTIPVKINNGINIIEDPIDLIGIEIPNLASFNISVKPIDSGLQLAIIPLIVTKGANDSYESRLNYPCLDIKVGIRIYEQIEDGQYVQEETETGSDRGQELYSGYLAWDWDSNPQAAFRYSVKVPKENIKETEAPYWVIDSLIIVPNPQQINEQELYQILAGIEDITDVDELETYFKPYESKLRFFYESYWNIQALNQE